MESVSPVNERYDLICLLDIINKYGFKRVVLQFPDEELEHSIPVYDFLINLLPEDIDVFVTADSTWGSSIDDVSAMHCDGDLLAYFGTDLSSSGTLPVAIVPPKHFIDVDACCSTLVNELTNLDNNGMSNRKIVLFYEPGYYEACVNLGTRLPALLSQTAGGFSGEVELASLPPQADLVHWEPAVSMSKLNKGTQKDPSESSEHAASKVTVGGLLVSEQTLSDKSVLAIYIGDKQEQIVNLLLRISENDVLHYRPPTSSGSSSSSSSGVSPVHLLRGTESREFRERYGGVMRVKDAAVVGILVASMGLTSDLTKDIMERLQQLILAAHKKFYCFVMGRLNEAKLCNFPEVCFRPQIQVYISILFLFC
jgi:diphthamide biosynthesis protein 2